MRIAVAREVDANEPRVAATPETVKKLKALGAVFLHLAAELIFYRLFNEAIEDFSVSKVAARQSAALAEAGLEAAG